MSNQSNPYEAPPVSEPVKRPHSKAFFKQFVIALLAFFMAFWAGALAIFFCVVLHEKGLL